MLPCSPPPLQDLLFHNPGPFVIRLFCAFFSAHLPLLSLDLPNYVLSMIRILLLITRCFSQNYHMTVQRLEASYHERADHRKDILSRRRQKDKFYGQVRLRAETTRILPWTHDVRAVSDSGMLMPLPTMRLTQR